MFKLWRRDVGLRQCSNFGVVMVDSGMRKKSKKNFETPF
jgi:hypothetical protein